MSKFAMHLYITLLFLMLSIPAIQVFTLSKEKLQDMEKSEKRTYTQWVDKFSPRWKSMFDQMGEYVNDRFGYRLDMTSIYRNIHLSFFNRSMNPDVEIGKDGWLFINEHDLCEVIKGLKKIDAANIKTFIDRTIERANWLAIHDIKYYLLMPPLKHSIYSDKMPEKYDEFADIRVLNHEILNVLSSQPNITVINVEDSIRAHRNEHLYFKSDTHWNHKGSYYAYKNIYGQLVSDGFEILSPMIKTEDIEMRLVRGQRGDLNNLLKDDNVYFRTKTIIDTIYGQEYSVFDDPDYFSDRVVIEKTKNYKNEKESARVYILNDSYILNLLPYLRGHFNALACQWSHHFYPDKILKFETDIYIEEYYERMLIYSIYAVNPSYLKDDIMKARSISSSLKPSQKSQ